MTSRFLFVVALFGIAGLGCARATFREIDAGEGGKGGGAAGIAGHGGTGGDGQGGMGGGAGDVIGGNGGGGTGGSTGLAGGGNGGVDGGGTGGGGVGGGTGGVGGRGGTGGVGGIAGTGGTGGRGGTGGVAGTGGMGGTAGTSAGGRGGSGGTGGAPGVMPTVAGQIVVTELLHDVNGVENSGEWFEVYNPSMTVTYDLMGCIITDITNSMPVTINTPLVMPPGAFKALAISSTPGFTPDFVYGPNIKFDNDNMDQVTVSCGGVVIDTFGYSMADATDPTTTGHSFSVDPDHYSAADNDVRANWCLGTTMYTMAGSANFGTPGAPNPQCP